MDESFIRDSLTATSKINNHIFCQSNEFGFRYRVVQINLTPEEQLSYVSTVTHNAIFFHLSGEMHLNWDNHKDVVIKPGNLYFLPRGANISAYAVGDEVKYVVARLDHNPDTKVFNEVLKIKLGDESYKYIFSPLLMKPIMTRFIETVRDYIIQGADCVQLHNIKFLELYIIFRRYYTTEECTNLFYPIIGRNSEFETFVLDNYHMSVSIDELVQKANMSRSTFDRKFKETFKITPLKWIEEQTRQLIFRKASEPNVTVKDIMYEVDVYNQSQFTHLCKRLCGVSPSKLIRMK